MVKGGPFNDEFNSVYMEKQEKFLNEVGHLRNRLIEVSGNDSMIIQQKIRDLMAAETQYTTDYIESHPESTVSVYLLMWKYFGLPIEEWGRLLSILSPEMKATSVYKRMESDYQKRLEL